MLGETFAIVHLVLIKVKDIAHDFLHDLRSGRFRLVLVIFLELLALRTNPSSSIVEAVNGCIEQANGGICLHILVNAVREKNPLSSVRTFFVCHILSS